MPIAAIVTVGAGAFDLGLLTVALTLPGAILAWFGGGIVDRHRRRPLMIGADLVRAVALLSIPFAAIAGRVTLPLLYAVAVITGIATVLYHLADHVFITDLVAGKRLLDANGKREAVDAVAEISGPALGGALVAWLTAPIAIAADALTFVASALLLAKIGKREAIAPPPSTTSFIDDVRTGIRVVWRNATIRALFLATATLTFCMSFMASLYTLFALSDLGLSAAELGVTIGCGGIGGLAGAVLARPAALALGRAPNADRRARRRRRGAGADSACSRGTRCRDDIPDRDASHRRRRAHRLPHQRNDPAATVVARPTPWAGPRPPGRSPPGC